MKPTGSNRLVIFLASVALLLGSAGLAAAQPVETPGLQFGQRQPHLRPDGAIRLATYNIENVFDHANDPDEMSNQAGESAVSDIEGTLRTRLPARP